MVLSPTTDLSLLLHPASTHPVPTETLLCNNKYKHSRPAVQKKIRVRFNVQFIYVGEVIFDYCLICMSAMICSSSFEFWVIDSSRFAIRSSAAIRRSSSELVEAVEAVEGAADGL